MEAALIRAQRDHAKREHEWDSDWRFDEHPSLSKCVMDSFLPYARVCLQVGREGVWTVDKVREQAWEGLRLIAIEVTSQTDYPDRFLERGSRSLSPDAQREFKETAQWHDFEDELLAFAEHQSLSMRDPPQAVGATISINASATSGTVPLGNGLARLNLAEKELRDSCAAHEQMRELVLSEGWWRGGQHYDPVSGV